MEVIVTPDAPHGLRVHVGFQNQRIVVGAQSAHFATYFAGSQ